MPNYSAAATLTSRTTSGTLGAVSGTVTYASGSHHGLANVKVHLFSPTPPYAAPSTRAGRNEETRGSST